MLVLLDENLPNKLRLLIPCHDVRRVAYQGWKALSNGALLSAAEDAGFDVMLAGDKNRTHQQNMQGGKLALVVLSSNERELVVAQVAQIIAAVNAATVGSFVPVDIGS